MKAVTFHGPFQVRVSDVEEPQVRHPQDVILRVTLAGICGSDIHAYDGRMPMPATGWTLGHEYIGEVVEVGSAVDNFKPGDRAVGSFISACGECQACRDGWPTGCPSREMFGFLVLPGAQAEYLRVPFGHYTLQRVPEGVGDERALLVGDVFSTGYFCADQGGIKPGDVVAVVGCGPVGLLAQMSALLFEPKVVLAIDSLPGRLAMSKRIGAVPVDASQAHPMEAILEHSLGRGADVVLEAVGVQSSLRACFDYVRGGGTISAVGMYTEPEFPFPMFKAFLRDVTFKVGMCPVQRYMGPLLNLLQEGSADPSVIVTHVLPLSDAPHGYEIFQARRENCIKVLLKV